MNKIAARRLATVAIAAVVALGGGTIAINKMAAKGPAQPVAAQAAPAQPTAAAKPATGTLKVLAASKHLREGDKLLADAVKVVDYKPINDADRESLFVVDGQLADAQAQAVDLIAQKTVLAGTVLRRQLLAMEAPGARTDGFFQLPAQATAFVLAHGTGAQYRFVVREADGSFSPVLHPMALKVQRLTSGVSLAAELQPEQKVLLNGALETGNLFLRYMPPITSEDGSALVLSDAEYEEALAGNHRTVDLVISEQERGTTGIQRLRKRLVIGGLKVEEKDGRYLVAMPATRRAELVYMRQQGARFIPSFAEDVRVNRLSCFGSWCYSRTTEDLRSNADLIHLEAPPKDEKAQVATPVAQPAQQAVPAAPAQPKTVQKIDNTQPQAKAVQGAQNAPTAEAAKTEKK